jgi:hypothetical protein
MKIKLNKGELFEKAELVMAVKGYEIEEKQKWDKGIDYIITQEKSDDKVLLRVITKPKTKSGIVGIDAVREMRKTMKNDDYSEGILLSKSFSQSAEVEMREECIQLISERVMPSFKPQRLYLAMLDYIDDLCQTKCGLIPKQDTDCKGISDDQYSCKIRLISDNASFHFEQGWTNLVQKDFEQLIALHNSKSDKDI